MKMRELEERTGVHREVIRVYLRHGLIPEPDRPRRTLALYREEHVQAIAAIRRLQRESRLTLGQIKTLMNGGGPEGRVEASAFDQLEQLVTHRSGADGPPVPVHTLVSDYPQAQADAKLLADVGIVDLIDTPEGPAVSISSAQLVRIWGEMRKAGFGETLNFTPAMLGFYTEAADFVGRWEASTFLERTDGKVALDDAAAMVTQALPLMLDFFGLLRQRSFFRHVEALNKGLPPVV